MPLELSSFVGRKEEIAEVKRLLGEVRLLTLTGAGGCGKTRLALAVASDMVGGHEEGAWLVELAPLSDSELVPQAVASVLEVREQPARPLTQTLAEHLRPQEEYLKEGPEPLAFPLQMLATRDIYEEARARDEGDHFLLLAGEGLGMLKDGQGAAEIVAKIVSAAEATLARLAGEAPAGAG